MCRPFAPAAPLCAPHDRQIIARITSDRHLNFELFRELELQSISISWAGLAAITLSRPKALPGIEIDAKHEARAHSEIPRGATHVLESVESRSGVLFKLIFCQLPIHHLWDDRELAILDEFEIGTALVEVQQLICFAVFLQPIKSAFNPICY